MAKQMRRRHTWYYIDISLAGRIVAVWFMPLVRTYVIELGAELK